MRVCEKVAGLTRREWRVLAFVEQHQGLLSSELAISAMLDRARTSRALKELEAKGLVERRPRPSNRREVQVFVTKKGRATNDQLLARVAAINRQLLMGFNEVERELLADMLTRLQSLADKLAL